MPGDRKFELGDYVEVKDRIRILYELYPQARIVTDTVEILTAPDGKQRVMVKALAYRHPDDPLPGVGHSWLELPGKTPYTNGSELENAETSAWGRAIASLGILIDKSIASYQEVDNKAGHAEEAREADGLIGKAIAQGNHDFNLRQTPDGWVLPFRIKDGAKSFIVRAENEMAQALATIKDTVIDQRVTVWGRWEQQVIPAKGTKPAIKYNVLVLDRIATPDGIIPAPAWDSEPEPVDPESLPLFSEDEDAAITAALEKVG